MKDGVDRLRDPPLVPPDASRLRQFATQSETCAMFGEDLYVMPFFPLSDVQATDGFEL